MSQAFANGKIAWGLCDRCGQRHYLKELTFQVVNQVPTGIRVCSSCNDIDHPQLQLGKFPINDPIALRAPRPDIDPGRSLSGWNPVGNSATTMNGNVGSVAVYIQ